ncbi:MAG: hypothetical protein AAF206_21125 [Bacteroidota bacterium]
MKTLIIGLFVFFSALGLRQIWQAGPFKKKAIGPSFEEQFATFQILGFDLNPGASVKDILRWEEGKKEFEDEPWTLMYITLGQSLERDPWTPLTDRCWNFDLEAIEDHGSYVSIMENISRITNGELEFRNLRDYVDLEEEVAWVSFELNGRNYKWNLRVDDDWADGDLFDKVQELARFYDANGRFTYFNTGGQDFVLGYLNEEEFHEIKEATGLQIKWLKAKGQIYR